jgi:prephenate dehydrogenase
MKQLGIIGFGSFGSFMAAHLRPFFEIVVFDLRDLRSAAEEAGVEWGSFETVVAVDALILAVPVQDMEDVLERVAGCPALPTIAIDVASVKVRPLELMKKWLPESVEILGTHPMFGPQSGRDGIRGLKVVVCPHRTTRLDRVRSLLEKDLGLRVLEMRPEDHDAEMAYVQGLTHWIAKALREIKLPNLKLSTPAYRHLLAIEEILREDSDALFRTIQAENPFAAEARRELVARLREIEAEIEGGESS